MANRKPTQAATLKTNGNKKIDPYLIQEYNSHSLVVQLVGINDLLRADARCSDKPNAFVLPSKAPPNKQQASKPVIGRRRSLPVRQHPNKGALA
jgi:hypothetical protein